MSFVCLCEINSGDAHWRPCEIFKLWHNKTRVEDLRRWLEECVPKWQKRDVQRKNFVRGEKIKYLIKKVLLCDVGCKLSPLHFLYNLFIKDCFIHYCYCSRICHFVWKLRMEAKLHLGYLSITLLIRHTNTRHSNLCVCYHCGLFVLYSKYLIKSSSFRSISNLISNLLSNTHLLIYSAHNKLSLCPP